MKKLIIIALVIGIIAVIILSILQRQPALEVSQEFSTNVDSQISTIYNVSFTGDSPNLPTTLPILDVTNTHKHPEVIQHLIENYELETVVANNLWVNQQTNVSLSQTTLGCYLFDTASDPSNTVITTSWTTEQVLDAATSFLTEVVGETGVTPLVSDIYYLSGFLGEAAITAPLAADHAVVPFSYTFQNTPVFYSKDLSLPFHVHIDRNLQPFMLDFCPTSHNFTQKEVWPLLSVDQAVANISRNRGNTSILAIGQENFQDYNPSLFNSGTLNTVSLEYRIDETAKLAYPFYRFTGTLIDRSNVPVEVQLITPAINVAVTR